MILLIWALKVSLLSVRSRILSVRDMGRELIVYWFGVVLLPVVLMDGFYLWLIFPA